MQLEHRIMEIALSSQNGSIAVIGLFRLANVANKISVCRNRSERDNG